MTTLLDDLEQVCDRVSAAKAEFAAELAELRRAQTAVHEVLQAVDDSWSQSNVGYHADLYFGDFERPSLGQRFDPEWGGVYGIPEGWSDRTTDDVQQVVAARASITVGQLVDTVNARVDEVRQLVTDVCVSLAPIRLTQGLEREAEMLDALESVDFTPGAPFSIPGAMSRDSTAIAQGMRIAPHQAVRQRVRVAARALAVADTALQDADRLARRAVAQLRAGLAFGGQRGHPPRLGGDDGGVDLAPFRQRGTCRSRSATRARGLRGQRRVRRSGSCPRVSAAAFRRCPS